MTTAKGSPANLRRAVRHAFAPGCGTRRIGVEIELIAVTDEAAPRIPDPAGLADGFDAAFVRAARPSFEPGGQLELSLAPRTSATALLADIERLVGRVRTIGSRRGIRLESVGTNPYHAYADVPLFQQTPRYLAMQDLFDQVGPDGRRMMRLTAALQISIDLLPGRAGREQWLVANLAGPALTGMFANSPYVDGRHTDVPGARTRIWLGVDQSRTGHDGRHLDPLDPIGAYTAFAGRARRFPIPEAADVGYHLSTLFPPVRPRGGYLEIRYLDSQPVERIGDVLAILAGLCFDPTARRDAIELLLPRIGELTSSWRAAAAGAAPDAEDLLAIALDGATRLPPGYAPVSAGAIR